MSEKGTEKASPQRVQKARERGDVVRSRDLLSATAMLAGVLVMGLMSSGFVQSWGKVFSESLNLARVDQFGSDGMWRTGFRHMLGPVIAPVGTMMAVSFLAALGVGIAQGGGLAIHPTALELKFDRFNPVTNLSNLFSLRSATRVVKSLVPAAVMVVFGWTALKALMVPMPVMSLFRLPSAFTTSYHLALDAAWVTLLWSGLDYAIEWRARSIRLKATKQEVRQEMKEAMGNPEIKSRVRQIQRMMRKRKVKADMSKASVVVTNPTHYAVALEFSFDTMQAPTVLAKGRDLHAAEIREEARWAGIPIIENPPLARSLYKTVEPGQSIPYELYAAVAGILAFLYRQKVEEKLRQDKERAARQARDNADASRRMHQSLLGFGGGI